MGKETGRYAIVIIFPIGTFIFGIITLEISFVLKHVQDWTHGRSEAFQPATWPR